jgi:hypothetical protein
MPTNALANWLGNRSSPKEPASYRKLCRQAEWQDGIPMNGIASNSPVGA